MSFIDKVKKLFVDYFSLGNYLVPQAEAEAAIREGVSFRGTSMIILVLAIFIASLGLNTNSTAVIIGAMLISPLMGPIIGIGLGVGIQDFALLKQCLRNLTMAAFFSILASALYFLISPVSEGHSELLARTSPTIYDVLIGFFGGGAGIIALGSRSKGNVIPGVAIATALMPPLCTVGYGLATLQPHYFLGALYLFLINSVYIALATFIGVKLMNYRHAADVDPDRARKVKRLVYIVALVVLLPSIYLTYTMLRQTGFAMKANRFVETECRFPDTQVLSSKAFFAEGKKELTITLIGHVLPTDSLRLALASRLQYYGLQGTHINIIQGATPVASAENPFGDATMKDIYEIAQNKITSQQHTIDSLRAVLTIRDMTDTLSASLTPEIQVVFPRVSEIAIARPVFASVADSVQDTVCVALVRYSAPLPPADVSRLEEYLKARLSLKQISIVNVGNSINFNNEPQNQRKK